MWVEANMFWGPVIVALTSMVTTVAFIPGTLLALGSGWVFKQAYGSLWIAILLAAGAVWLGAAEAPVSRGRSCSAPGGPYQSAACISET